MISVTGIRTDGYHFPLRGNVEKTGYTAYLRPLYDDICIFRFDGQSISSALGTAGFSQGHPVLMTGTDSIILLRGRNASLNKHKTVTNLGVTLSYLHKHKQNGET